MHSGRNQAGDVRHVGEDRRADAIGRDANAREIDHARVGAGADDDHLRMMLVSQPIDLVVVDPLVGLPDAVGDDRVQLAREVEGVAVRQVAAVGEVHAEDGVSRLEQREVDRHVGLRPGMRLHVGMVGAEERGGARNRRALGDVDELAASVVPLARVAFGVLVRQDRSGGLEDRLADEVFRRDQLEAAVLPVEFVAENGGNLRIGFREGAPHRGGGGVGGHDCFARLKPSRFGCGAAQGRDRSASLI